MSSTLATLQTLSSGTQVVEPVTYLDALPLHHAQVGYGTLGRDGSLGYEGKSVTVHGQPYSHALSTHPPARLIFQVDGQFTSFQCQVALNDDVRPGISHADFTVLADHRAVAVTPHVVAGDPPRPMIASIEGAQLLELVVNTSRWEYCHAVWLDPQLGGVAVAADGGVLLDCMGRTEITLPAFRPKAFRCIATVVSAAFVHLLDDMLGSLCANSGCQDALLVVFAVDDDPKCRLVAAKYGATLIRCTPRVRLNVSVKALLYSVARVIDAQEFLCLDADMIVLDNLGSIFAAIEACPDDSILACREGNGRGFRDLEHILTTAYGGSSADLVRLLGTSNGEGAYPFVANDGLFAGSRSALLALDGVIRAMPQAGAWVEERRDMSWRNQFIFSLALARLGCGIELDSSYNVQLHVQDVDLHWAGVQMQATWHGRGVRVLHFSGAGRNKYPEWRGLFAQIPDPLVGFGGGYGYTEFLVSLRAWVGRYGLKALAWSFYGTGDARTAQVRDPSTLPLLALLHFLIRSSGCIRVLETGTARGVSAACLASAVAHRVGGRVVTFDPYPQVERAALWATLCHPL